LTKNPRDIFGSNPRLIPDRQPGRVKIDGLTLGHRFQEGQGKAENEEQVRALQSESYHGKVRAWVGYGSSGMRGFAH
jgi:hypothetical protein